MCDSPYQVDTLWIYGEFSCFAVLPQQAPDDSGAWCKNIEEQI